MLVINVLAGSKYLLPGVKVGSKNNILVAKFGGHITAHLPPVHILVRFKTKQNSIWLKMSLTIMELCLVLQTVK